MIDLRARWHGAPVFVWIGGGTVTIVAGLILLRRYRAAKAGAATGNGGEAASKYGSPLPGWEGLSDALGPLGGSSPTGPLLGYTSDGTPVYGLGVIAPPASIGTEAPTPLPEIFAPSAPPTAEAYAAPVTGSVYKTGLTLEELQSVASGTTQLPAGYDPYAPEHTITVPGLAAIMANYYN